MIKGTSFAALVGAFVRRDLQASLSYRLPFLFDVLAAMFAVVTYSFVAELVAPGTVPGDYFTFALAGLTVAVFLQAGVGNLGASLRQEQLQGTLEAVMSVGIRPHRLAVASIAYPLAWAAILSVFYVGIGAILGASAPGANWPLAIAATVAGAVSFAGLGFAGASLVLVFRRGVSIVGWAILLLTMAGGELYPVEVLPEWLASVSSLSPYTRCLGLVRGALLEGWTWRVALNDLVVLVLGAVSFVVLGVLAFTGGIRRSRRTGGLAGY